MKKLMIAAVVAAMGVSAMADCEEAFCAYAYRVKLAGKTVKGKSITDTTSKKTYNPVSEDCEYDSACFAKPASLRIAGYLYDVGEKPEDECSSCDFCEKIISSDVFFHFWDENKQPVKVDDVKVDTFDVLRNSGACDKAQILITMDGLNLAGFGAFNPKTHKLKSASGFFAGSLAAPECKKWDGTICDWGDPTPAKVFAPCLAEDGSWVVDSAKKAIAFGRWSMTYKADKVATIEKTGSIDCLFPAAYPKTAAAE